MLVLTPMNEQQFKEFNLNELMDSPIEYVFKHYFK